jgi:hypothetical protein
MKYLQVKVRVNYILLNSIDTLKVTRAISDHMCRLMIANCMLQDTKIINMAKRVFVVVASTA